MSAFLTPPSVIPAILALLAVMDWLIRTHA